MEQIGLQKIRHPEIDFQNTHSEMCFENNWVLGNPEVVVLNSGKHIPKSASSCTSIPSSATFIHF